MIKKRQLKAKMIELYKKTPKTIKILLHSKANLLRFIANFLRFIKNSKTVRYFAFQISSLKADSRFGWPNNFYMFWSIFLLKKENYRVSAFVQPLFSTKKSPKIVNLPLTVETLCLSFWRHKHDKWIFQFSKLSWGSYVSL